MALDTSKLSIINTALGYIGEPPVLKVDETAASLQANSIYNKSVQSRMESFSWSFTTYTQRLQPKRDTNGDIIRSYYNSAYIIYENPANMLRLINVFGDGEVNTPLKIEIDNEGIHTNDFQVYSLFARYVKFVDEIKWPAYFVRMIEFSIASELAHLNSKSDSGLIFDKLVSAEREARAAETSLTSGNDTLGNPDYFTHNMGGVGGSPVTNHYDFDSGSGVNDSGQSATVFIRDRR